MKLLREVYMLSEKVINHILLDGTSSVNVTVSLVTLG